MAVEAGLSLTPKTGFVEDRFCRDEAHMHIMRTVISMSINGKKNKQKKKKKSSAELSGVVPISDDRL